MGRNKLPAPEEVFRRLSDSTISDGRRGVRIFLVSCESPRRETTISLGFGGGFQRHREGTDLSCPQAGFAFVLSIVPRRLIEVYISGDGLE